MKITKYFVSSEREHTQLSLAITDAETKKNQFIEDNKNDILEIEKEEIKFLAVTNNQYLYAIIQLTYYLK